MSDPLRYAGDSTFGADDSTQAQAARLALALRLTQDLRQAIDLAGIDEFTSQEAQFDQDSRLGRELLYLIANDEWNRATREIVTLDASDSVPTTIQVHVDLSRIAHEAFRNRLDRVWLPLAVLPPPKAGPATERQLAGPRVAPSPTVRDRSGNVLPSLPQSEARRWIAAAMAEIILTISPAAMNADHSAGQLAREQRLLLSAAIYRLLRQGSDHTAGPAQERQVADAYRHGRIQEARGHLGDLFDGVLQQLGRPGGPGRSTLLIRRAARVLHAVSSPTTLVVVSVDPQAESEVFSVGVPARPLLGRRRPLSAPRAQVDLHMLLPAVDADRAFVVNLPEGLSFLRPARWQRSTPTAQAPGGRLAPVQASISVERPRILGQIDDLLRQLNPPGPGPSDPVARSLVDFTVSRMDIARDAYRHYRATPTQAQDGQLMADLVPDWNWTLHQELRGIRAESATPGPGAGQAARDAVRRSQPDVPGTLFRAHEGDVISPRRAHIRVPAVENRNVRATPQDATVRLQLVADDSTPLRAARNSGFMSLLLLSTVLAGSWWLGPRPADAQVLASVLTLFAAIQAGRIASPDRSTLRGLLISGGTWVIVASVLPPVLLGVALAFGDHPDWVFAAALGTQVLLQIIMYTPPVTGSLWRWSRQPSLQLRSDRAAPDHARIDVLHSSWWRSTTAAALLLGAGAHGYVLARSSGGVADLLGGDEPRASPLPKLAQRFRNAGRRINRQANGTGQGPHAPGDVQARDDAADADPVVSAGTPQTPANILAMLRAGTSDRSLTFLVFREEPEEAWQRQTQATVELDPDRLTAHEAAIGNLDVFIGLPAGRLRPLQAHPLRHLLEVAARRQLLILDVQFPVPPPLGAGPGRSWTRTRIGLRGDEISTLSDLLTAIQWAVEYQGGHSGPGSGDALDVDLLVDTSTQTPPRRFLGSPAPALPGRAQQAMRPSALNILTDVASPPAAKDWLTVAICDYAHAGAEERILDTIIERHPGLDLAGLTLAVLHGTCVVFALGHQPGVPAGGTGTTKPTALPRDLQLLVEQWTTDDDLGRLPDSGLLLAVHAQYSDRPGLFSVLADELGQHLAAAAGHRFAAEDLRLSHVHTEVADGRNATTWFMIHLPAPAVLAQFDRLVLDRVERAGRRVLTAPAGDDPPTDHLGLPRTATAVVSIEVVTVPFAPAPATS